MINNWGEGYEVLGPLDFGQEYKIFSFFLSIKTAIFSRIAKITSQNYKKRRKVSREISPLPLPGSMVQGSESKIKTGLLVKFPYHQPPTPRSLGNRLGTTCTARFNICLSNDRYRTCQIKTTFGFVRLLLFITCVKSSESAHLHSPESAVTSDPPYK